MNKIIQKLIIISILCFSMPSVKAVPLVVDGGWQSFDFPGQLTAPDPLAFIYPWDESFEFTLTQPGLLTVQDAFSPIDQFWVFDNGLFILQTSSNNSGGFNFTNDPDVAALDPDFSRGTILLGIGDHVITGGEIRHSSDSGGAGFIRIDTVAVTEPSILSLLIFGLLIFYSRQLLIKNKRKESFVI